MYYVIMLLADALTKLQKKPSAREIVKTIFWSFYDMTKVFPVFPIIFEVGSRYQISLRPEEKNGLTKAVYDKIPDHFVIRERVKQDAFVHYFVSKLPDAIGVICVYRDAKKIVRWADVYRVGTANKYTRFFARAVRGWESRTADYTGASPGQKKQPGTDKTDHTDHDETVERRLNDELIRRDKSASTVSMASGGGGTKKPHIRQGGYAYRWCGPGHTEKKLVKVRSCTVNAQKGGVPLTVYK